MQTIERKKIIQNLKAGGCNEALISEFMACFDAGRKKEALRLLATHRQKLLDQFHKCNDHIVCLDYLAHQIENKNV